MTYAIESRPPHSARARERLTVRHFKTSEAMHAFLNTGDNSLRWIESTKGLKAGTYAFAGGRWHNVRHLDPSLLAHI